MISRLCHFAVCIAGFALSGSHAHARTPITFESGKAQGPGYATKATTDIDLSGNGPPRVSRVRCFGEGPEFVFEMDGTTDLVTFGLEFLGEPDSDDRQTQITLRGDHLWLFIDGERWEYANIPVRPFVFKNIAYPPPDGDILIEDWRGHQAVRRNETEPWINLKLIFHRLISAKQVRWGFKSRDWTVVDRTIPDNNLPNGWQSKRYDIDTHGLQDAFD